MRNKVMSRENRMLLMFFFGMVSLFTYFRIQYPNQGEVERQLPSDLSPEVWVRCDSGLLDGVTKVARSYELEAGVRIVLEEAAQTTHAIAEFDILIVPASDASELNEARAVTRMTLTAPDADESAGGWELGVREVDRRRNSGALRFARYLTARDRGQLVLFSNDSGDSGESEKSRGEGDLWVEEPTPELLVWEGVYPFFDRELERFARTERVQFRTMVGACRLLSQKLTLGERVDAVLGFGATCEFSESLADWQSHLLATRQLVLLQPQRSSVDLMSAEWQPSPDTVLFGLDRGLDWFLSRARAAELPNSVGKWLRETPVETKRRWGDVKGALFANRSAVALGMDWPGQMINSSLSMHEFGGESGQLELRLWVAPDSDYRRLLGRLATRLEGMQMDASEFE